MLHLPNRLRPIAAAALGAIVVLGATACYRTDRGPEGDGGPTVALLGDSITYGAADQLDAALRTDHRTMVDAVIGQSFLSMYGQATNQAALAPDVLVVNLGTNDLGSQAPDIVLGHEADLLALYPATTCRVIVTVDRTGNGGFVRATMDFERRLTAPADEVVDWASATAADPSLVHDDGVHPTEAGTVRYAAMVRDGVLRCDARRAASHPTGTDDPTTTTGPGPTDETTATTTATPTTTDAPTTTGLSAAPDTTAEAPSTTTEAPLTTDVVDPTDPAPSAD